jgi:hypothetical protein
VTLTHPDNLHGQLGDGTGVGSNAARRATGKDFQLGLGDQRSRFIPTRVLF